jgi:flagellar biosynthetic protein FliP
MLSAAAAFAVTLGLLFLALHLLRRVQGGGARRGRVALSVVHRIPTGPRQSVALLRVGDRVLVVSLAEGGATLLTELSGDVLREALEPEAPAAGRASLPPVESFGRQLLARLGLILLLALAPAAAHAQAAPARPPQTQPSPAPGAPGKSAPPVPVQTISPAPAAQGPTPRTPAPGGPTVTPPPLPKIDFRIGDGPGELHLSGTVGLVLFMGALTLLPAVFLLMTSFTRIVIVLHFLRSALGTQTAPPGQLLVALAVLLTGVVMHPVLERANQEALTPYFDGKLSQTEAYQKGLVPFREFMLANVREQDLGSFAEMSGVADVKSADELPTVTIMAAFVTSELRTAFQMGFVIFLPFIVVDMIVASVLMSMGMMMLPPVMVSLPFKLLLFVLADGWTLVVRNLVASFRM